MTDKLTVHLWDEVSGEWGETYIDAGWSNANNHEIHEQVEKSIDHEPATPEDATKIKYSIWTPSLSLNIGTFGRGMLYVEIWGADAEGVIRLLDELYWLDQTPNSQRQILADVTNAQVKLHATRRRDGQNLGNDNIPKEGW